MSCRDQSILRGRDRYLWIEDIPLPSGSWQCLGDPWSRLFLHHNRIRFPTPLSITSSGKGTSHFIAQWRSRLAKQSAHLGLKSLRLTSSSTCSCLKSRPISSFSHNSLSSCLRMATRSSLKSVTCRWDIPFPTPISCDKALSFLILSDISTPLPPSPATQGVGNLLWTTVLYSDMFPELDYLVL